MEVALNTQQTLCRLPGLPFPYFSRFLSLFLRYTESIQARSHQMPSSPLLPPPLPPPPPLLPLPPPLLPPPPPPPTNSHGCIASNAVFVSHLNRSTTEEELYDAFKHIGQIVGSGVSRDSNTKACRGGLVYFTRPEDRDTALRTMDGAKIKGSEVVVCRASITPADIIHKNKRKLCLMKTHWSLWKLIVTWHFWEQNNMKGCTNKRESVRKMLKSTHFDYKHLSRDAFLNIICTSGIPNIGEVLGYFLGIDLRKYGIIPSLFCEIPFHTFTTSMGFITFCGIVWWTWKRRHVYS